MSESIDSKLREHIEYILHQVSIKIDKAKLSGALSGEENEHALIRACTILATQELVLTKEAKELYENLQKMI